MMRSMYSGVSSLRAHQVRMDVIGNNIANVNTVGFKGSKATFAEIYSQTVKGAGGSSTSRGGTNPQQVGLGIKLDSINVSHSKGATQRTDNATDIMIDGNGFFVLSPSADGQNKFFSRAGNFQVDELGYLVTSDGYFVLGADGKPVQIDSTTTVGAEKTTSITVGGNLSFSAEPDPTNNNIAYSRTLDVYNSVGGIETVNIDFGEKIVTAEGTALANVASYRMVKIGDYGTLDTNKIGGNAFNPTAVDPGPGDTAASKDDAFYAKFDSKGSFLGFVTDLDATKTDTDDDGTADTWIINDATVVSPTILGAATVAESTFDVNIEGLGVETVTFTVNQDTFKNLKHYDQETDISAKAITGRAAGNLSSYTIGGNGQVNMTYTNGESDSSQQIALADFDNPAGLLKVGTNRFIESPNSGTAKLGIPNSGSFGALTPGALEMSNVDLSAEFTDMITTQRGFQANSRVITTSDEILQELVNLKR